MELLAPKFHLLAPDLYGAGKSPQWPSDRVIRLRDEVALIEPVLARAGSPLALVGHSYGAAVALIAALANPARVRAMALYEPVLFALLDAETPAPNEAEGIRTAVADASVALDAGNQDAAAERFIDYWMGSGTWKRTPADRKPPIVESVTNVRRWAHALFTEPTPLKAFQSLNVPVLYMVGKHSTPSALGVARLLMTALRRVEIVEFENLGHMGPVTHPDTVNEVIEQFLERHNFDVADIDVGFRSVDLIPLSEHRLMPTRPGSSAAGSADWAHEPGRGREDSHLGAMP
jgi:pimeloyl-ACP methyl ester carboxylesterase